MAECILCKKSSLFLKVNEAGMCEKCWDEYRHKRTGKYGFTLQEKLIITDAFLETENSFLGPRPSMNAFFFALETDTLTKSDIMDVMKFFHDFLSIFYPEHSPEFPIEEITDDRLKTIVIAGAILNNKYFSIS